MASLQLRKVDSSILAATADRFAQYEAQVHAEYACVPDDTYRSKRVAILQTFLDRESIYKTRYFKLHSEAKTRQNLASSIANLVNRTVT